MDYPADPFAAEAYRLDDFCYRPPEPEYDSRLYWESLADTLRGEGGEA